MHVCIAVVVVVVVVVVVAAASPTPYPFPLAAGVRGTITRFVTTIPSASSTYHFYELDVAALDAHARDLLVGWLLLRQATVALAALGTDGVSAKDRAFYEGKVGVATFFAKSVLPRLTSDKAIIANADNELMELDEASF